ncbi:non-ribosomal peptide synthetase [Streptomyces sp. NBC_01563]|uniref:non-ribosomal peptide synthetase n=1 Tax=Streptomyces sp. NBC_01563 TaxID=2975880 RepID=UPI0038641237
MSSSNTPNRSVLEVIRTHAGARPDAPALYTENGTVISYLELVQRVDHTIKELRSLGINKGHRVAVVVSNDIASAILLLSLMHTTTCCPVNPAWSEAEIRNFLKALRPAAAVVLGGVSERTERAVAAHGVPVINATPRMGAVDLLLQGGALESPEVFSGFEDDALLLRTSGTTAEGKIVPLSMETVIAGASASARAYQLNQSDCRMNIMPFFHVQGLVGSLVCSLLAGGSVACLPTFEASSVLRWLKGDVVTWFSASPTMHRQLMDGEHGRPNFSEALRFVRCGSAALSPSLRKELEDCYRLPVIESYGMTEAHQIASTPLDIGRPTAGMMPTGSEVAVLTEDGTLVQDSSVTGELVVRGANVIRRYAWPPQATPQSFVGEWLRTGDQGHIAEDGSLLITGRIKELINRGGEKFSPYEVEDTLTRHPAVREAVVFPMPDPMYGEQAASAVVLRPGEKATEQELISFIGTYLSPYKVPRRVVQLDKIPTNASGKLARTGLAEELADKLEMPTTAEPATNITRPSNALEAALAGLWALALNRSTVGADQDFFALGGDSLAAMTLLTLVEEVFGVELSALVMFDRATSVADMAAEIQSLRQDASADGDRVGVGRAV